MTQPPAQPPQPPQPPRQSGPPPPPPAPPPAGIRPPIPPPRRTYPGLEQRQEDEAVGPALFGGAVAAFAGAIIWSLLVKWTEHEVSWFAWGVGALVGFTMSRVTPSRGPTLGVIAALLATLGLATGKLLSVRSAYMPVAREAILENEMALTVAFVFDLRAREAYSPDLQQRVSALGETDTLPDDLFAEMLEEAGERLETAPTAERQRVVRVLVDSALAAATMMQELRATLGLFDFLWFFLAIGTAWKLTQG